MDDCIFCKIVKGEIPSAKIYEDEECMAFLDINPAVKGHTLVIPKTHYETLLDSPSEELKLLIGKVQRIAGAVVNTVSAEGFNIIQNNKKLAGQIIPHVHFHIIPRFDGDGQDFSWEHQKYQEGELDEYKESIRKRL